MNELDNVLLTAIADIVGLDDDGTNMLFDGYEIIQDVTNKTIDDEQYAREWQKIVDGEFSKSIYPIAVYLMALFKAVPALVKTTLYKAYHLNAAFSIQLALAAVYRKAYEEGYQHGYQSAQPSAFDDVVGDLFDD